MLARALAVALLLALPSASAGPLEDVAREGEAVACELPDASGTACGAGGLGVSLAGFLDATLARPPVDIAQEFVCSPIGRQVCLAMSGDPGLGPWRPCTTYQSPEQGRVGNTLWHAMHGGNVTLEGQVVTLPTGVDVAVGAFSGTMLAGTPLEGERPCADHWRTLRSFVGADLFP